MDDINIYIICVRVGVCACVTVKCGTVLYNYIYIIIYIIVKYS